MHKKRFIQNLLSIAINASTEAYKRALETNIPFLVVENNALYEVQSNRDKKLIKKIPRVNIILQKKFTLK